MLSVPFVILSFCFEIKYNVWDGEQAAPDRIYLSRLCHKNGKRTDNAFIEYSYVSSHTLMSKRI